MYYYEYYFYFLSDLISNFNFNMKNNQSLKKNIRRITSNLNGSSVSKYWLTERMNFEKALATLQISACIINWSITVKFQIKLL